MAFTPVVYYAAVPTGTEYSDLTGVTDDAMSMQNGHFRSGDDVNVIAAAAAAC